MTFDVKPSSRTMSKQTESLPSKKPLTHTLSQPIETVNYTVSSSDTLLGIAARFDTTPSELTKLNKLTCGLIFPGQKILVPKKVSNVFDNKSDKVSLPNEQKIDENKVISPVSSETPLIITENDERSYNHLKSQKNDSIPRFLKILSRYITDGQGVVNGVLIVTPNAIMFDPNVSDPLVMEHSVENYGVIASLDMVMKAAIYYDIAHMAVSHLNEVPRNIPKPEIYVKPNHIPNKYEDHSGATYSNSQASLKFNENTIISNESDQLNQSKIVNEGLTRIRKIKSSDNVKECESSSDQVCLTKKKITDYIKKSDQDRKNLSKVHRANSCCEPLERFQTENAKEQISKQFSFPLQSHVQPSVERIKDDKESKIKELNHRDMNEKHNQSYIPVHDENSDLQKLRSSILSSFQNMNLDDKSHLFESLDEIISLVRPATSGFPPLYLCLRMGYPINKKIAKSSPFLNYHKKRLKREYWFSISRDKVDEVYDFFQYWVPHLYGDITNIDPEKLGFLPINEDDDDNEDDNDEAESLEEGIIQESGKSFEGAMKLIRSSPLSILKVVEDHFGGNNITEEDWEFLSMNESKKSPSAESVELSLPDLSEQSDILNDKEKRELCKHLPARALGYSWTLVYSTSKHGFSLKTLYRKMSNVESPVLLTISDTNGAVFGAMSSGPLKISEHFYGTGESFLYSFYNGFKYYPWSGENMYFIKGNIESLAFGAGEGHFGLWLDGDLYHGRSSKCKTYNNDCLSSQEDFVIKALEAWGFV